MKPFITFLFLTVVACGVFAQTPQPIIDMHFHAANFNDNGPPPNGISRLNTGYPVYEADKPWIATFMNWMANPQGENPIMAPTSNKELLDKNMEILKRRNIYAVSSGPREEEFKAAGKERIYSAWQLPMNIDKWPSPEEVRKVLATGKYKVFGEITLQYAGISPNDPRFAPYLVILEELDIPLGIHIGTGPPGVSYFPGIGKHLARMHSAFEIEEVALRHPKLRINLMHAGWPLADHLIAVLYNHPQVYCDVGIICYSLPREAFHDYLRRIVQAGFHRRIMFGSDQMNWPDAIEEGIKAIETADFLTEEQKRDILYNNAARFLRLSKEEIDRHHGR
ncbi:MAG: amidohydrolase family protein [Cyclobacteriaceae bacterium]|nr:amidohydrolase family protein [Cyclobacteriaceae bacterium]